MGSVLVIRGGAIGDFVLTLPAIGLLREGLPDATIEVLGYRPIVELAIAGGYVDASRSIEHGPLAGFFAIGAELDAEWCEYFASFDLVVSYLFDDKGIFRDNLKRAGVETLIEGLAKVDPSTGEHAAHQLARALESIAVFLDEPGPRLELDGGDVGEGRVAIHPGSGGAAKNWHLEYWIKLGESIAGAGERLLLVSGEAEEGKWGEVAAAWSAAGIDFVHAQSWKLPRLGAALGRCRQFLGHDSGVSHLAAATGVPCLLLFGPTNPAVWAPANSGVEVLCSPSGRMGDISYADVSARVGELLNLDLHHL
jgi:heptosyltransferase-3